MAKKSKKKKIRIRAADLSEARLSELNAELDSGSLAAIGDSEFLAFLKALEADTKVDSIVALAASAQGKAQRKAVNQTLFRLKGKGLVVPDTKPRKEPIKLGADLPNLDDLPAIMSAPHGNATRILFFPYLAGTSLWFVQAELREPVGLSSLKGHSASRSTYKMLLQQVATLDSKPGLPPAFAEVEPAFVRRKVWEMGRLVRSGRTTNAVDHNTTTVMAFPNDAPSHPIYDADLGDASPLSVGELDERKFALAPLMHEALFKRLEAKIEELEGGIIELTEAQKAERASEEERKLVVQWAEKWGLDNLAEVLLDTAYFQLRIGEPQLAKTFLEVVGAPGDAQRDDRVLKFVGQVVQQMRTGGK